MRSPDFLTAVGIGVSDLSRSVDFYAGVLGMKQIQTFQLDHMDEIVSVNGKPAEGIALYDLRERFKGAVGERFVLRVKSKGAERTVTLVLADQV